MGKSLEIAVRSFPNVDRGELQLWDRERGEEGRLGLGRDRKEKNLKGRCQFFLENHSVRFPNPARWGT